GLERAAPVVQVKARTYGRPPSPLSCARDRVGRAHGGAWWNELRSDQAAEEQRRQQAAEAKRSHGGQGQGCVAVRQRFRCWADPERAASRRLCAVPTWTSGLEGRLWTSGCEGRPWSPWIRRASRSFGVVRRRPRRRC